MVRKVTVNPMTTPPIPQRDTLEQPELGAATVVVPQSLVSSRRLLEGKHLAGV